MADPISLGVMFAVSAASSIMAASQKQQQADAQAAMYRQQAQQQRNAAALQSADIQRRADQAIGRQIAASGAAGVDVSGSIVDDLAQTRANAARDVFNVNYMGQSRSDNLEASASNAEFQGSQAMTNAFIGIGMNGVSMFGGSLLKGIGSGSSPGGVPVNAEYGVGSAGSYI